MAVVGVGVAVVGVDFTPKSPSERVFFEGIFEHFPVADDRSRLRVCGQGFPRGRIRCASPRADGTGSGRKDTAEHRAGTNRAAGAVWIPIFLARRCGPEMQPTQASVSASKIPSGPSPRGEEVVRTRIPSAPAPSRHRIPDHRGLSCPAATALKFSPRRATLLGAACSSTRPALRTGVPLRLHCSRKTSDLPPGIETFTPIRLPIFRPGDGEDSRRIDYFRIEWFTTRLQPRVLTAGYFGCAGDGDAVILFNRRLSTFTASIAYVW